MNVCAVCAPFTPVANMARLLNCPDCKGIVVLLAALGALGGPIEKAFPPNDTDGPSRFAEYAFPPLSTPPEKVVPSFTSPIRL